MKLYLKCFLFFTQTKEQKLSKDVSEPNMFDQVEVAISQKPQNSNQEETEIQTHKKPQDILKTDVSPVPTN